MGKDGTEVARQASDLILLDDNFGNIVEAAEEGRNIYWTIKKTILFFLSTNLSALIIITFAIISGMPLPLVAAQIIWLNLITDTFLNLALIFDPKEKHIMSDEYRSEKNKLFDNLMITRLLSMSIIMALITLTLFNNYLPFGIEKATTIAITTLTVLNVFNMFNVRSHIKSIFNKRFFNNKYLIIATLIASTLYVLSIYTPLMQKILKTSPLDFNDWFIIIGVSVSIIVIEEIRKYIYRISFKAKKYS
jgi:Ca2+-transporting ATPase